MKNLLIIIALLITRQSIAQDNILTGDELNNIQLNKRTWSSIWATQGEEVAFQNLFGGPANSIVRSNEDFYIHRGIKFYYSGFEIAFSAAADNVEVLRPYMFKLTNSSASLRIKGKTCRIGDNIIVLGDINMKTKANGDQIIIYTAGDYRIYIHFDQRTKIITEIGYFVLT